MTVQVFPRTRAHARIALWLCACAMLLPLFPQARAQNASAGAPVLLTEGTGTTTRGVAHDAITFRSEPFPVVSPFNWNADKSNTRDQQTRLTLFAMNLALLPGEGANALTADAQDATGRIYPLKVEALSLPKYVRLLPAPENPSQLVPTEVAQSWLYAVTLRLDEEMTDTLGDVLVRINLHGVASNRVRIAIGQTGAGIATDPSTEIISPAPSPEPTPFPALVPKAYGPGGASVADITRLLEQSTWGPKGDGSDVAHVQQVGVRAFLDEQFNAPVLNASKGSDFADLALVPDDSNLGCPADPNDPTGATRNACIRDNYSVYPLQVQFFKNTLTRQTQLRQRVAFALHQIFVVSQREIGEPSWYTPYLQVLDRNAFGNFRTLLQEITLNPAMGEYLNMNQSTAGNPNENYAREVLQLFSVGVNRLNPDGTPVLDSSGNPVPTYTQTTVNEFTRVFTGWRFAPALQAGNPPAGATNYRDPMVPRGVNNAHDTGAKTLFTTNVAACQSTNGSQNAACAQSDLNIALDVIFNHPNVGPFISRQLIQHLVTSNPTPAYVGRVAAVFNNDCAGLYPDAGCSNARGNMRAVVRAILLDPEARGDAKTDPSYGRLREPAQYIANVLRAFNASSDGVLGSFSISGDLPGQLDQPVFQPPTVFSYYSPDYEVPGAKMQGPAFQILYTSTTLRRANVVNRLIYSGIPVAPNNPTGTTLTWGELNAVWGEVNLTEDERATKLLDMLDARLMHGTMPAQMRATIKTAMLSVTPANSDQFWPQRRSQMAAYLITTSPQYDVQR